MYFIIHLSRELHMKLSKQINKNIPISLIAVFCLLQVNITYAIQLTSTINKETVVDDRGYEAELEDVRNKEITIDFSQGSVTANDIAQEVRIEIHSPGYDNCEVQFTNLKAQDENEVEIILNVLENYNHIEISHYNAYTNGEVQEIEDLLKQTRSNIREQNERGAYINSSSDSN